jgi:hypothetical protein
VLVFVEDENFLTLALPLIRAPLYEATIYQMDEENEETARPSHPQPRSSVLQP